MAILRKLQNHLEKNDIKYDVVEHRKVFTTYDTAATLNEDLNRIAKALLVQIDRDFAIAVIPGHRHLDISKLKKLINKTRSSEDEKAARKVALATEAQIKRKVTKQIGALPPFGSLYKMPTYLDTPLSKQAKIILNAGSFTEAIEMTPRRYISFEDPTIGPISKAPKKKLKSPKKKK